MVKLLIDTRVPYITDGEDIVVRLLVGDVSALMADDALQAIAIAQLSPFRREKALAIKHARGRAQSIGASLLLDTLLREHGLCERDMNYDIGEHGKPSFVHPSSLIPYPSSFSLSHSGSLAAAAMASRPLGLDIQRITRYRPELVRRVFSAADRQLLAAAPDEPSRQRLFAQLWSRAEAYAKATGIGLQWPFPTPPATALFHDFSIGDDYCGSLCVLAQSTNMK